MKLNNILLGQHGERLVAELYLSRGYEIVTTNFFNKHGKRLGELDVIAQKEKDLHFVEVKTRSSNSYGSALEAITKEKLKKIFRAISAFYAIHPEFRGLRPHLDIVVVELSLFDKLRQRINIYSDVIDEIDAEV